MENFYLILVVILFALAISDLIVGVSNDAVNFLNSAIGSKAAPKWMIFLMASLGVLVGATFSNGMMEVARKGIFHPDMFYFSEIMVIFLAVMITDIILLDMFNTFGLPTSTTVSIVFELLGSAVVVSIVKIKNMGGSIVELANYINSGKALAIITGILVSVFIAFTVGAIIQYLTRLVFSFNYRKPMKYLGSSFGGLAIMAITYFMLIKGMGGSSFANKEVAGETLLSWVTHHTGTILLYSFVCWTIIIQLLKWIFNIKILKVVVLVGTFALAMAFAGNDLVNFIGVPLAGYNSFLSWSSSGAPDAGSFSMEMLAGKVPTPTYMLLIAGLVMIITLITSKKARSVVSTTVDLSRQSEGAERFGSSLAARLIVRSTINFNKKLRNLMPSAVTNTVQSRFAPPTQTPSVTTGPDLPAFDKVRAAVNLVVASILIAIGTSLKLPLSTTYVTFMVAMGTSLSDRAWDRESAVYRISGVFAVVGGWFLTALVAFGVSGLIALLISIGGNFVIFVFIAVAIFMVIRTYMLFKKRSAQKTSEEEDAIGENDASEEILDKSARQVVKALIAANQILSLGIESFLNEDRNGLKKAEKACNEFSKKSKKNRDKVYSTLEKLTEGPTDTSHFYVQMMDYKREMAHATHYMLEPMIKHIENNHKPFIKEQSSELKNLIAEIDVFFNYVLNVVKKEDFNGLDNLIAKREKIFDLLAKIEKDQIKRIKNKDVNTRNSQLYFKIISEIRSLLLHTINLVKSQRDFFTHTKQNG